VSDDDRPTVDLGPRAVEPEAHDREQTASLVVNPPNGADLVHSLPTQELAARRPGSGTMTRASDSRTATSPAEAMRLEEVARLRVFLKVVLVMCVGGAIVALSTTGDAVLQGVSLAGSIAAALGTLWILMITRDAASYDPRRLVIPALPLVFGAMGGVCYWGAASPVAAMMVYGIYFISLSANRAVSLGIYLIVAVLHGAIIVGIMTGVLADHGVIKMSGLAFRDQVGIFVIVEFLYLFARFTARRSQQVTLDAMHNLEQAVRGNAQRDALLAEARAELDRALKVGGPGRFTEQTVGSYRLGMLIGRGGMGEVYEAHHVAGQREAAVKLLHPGTLAEPTHVQRFIREAKTAASLDCPYVVRVLEVGTTAGEIPFLAMERLRGYDLAHQLRRHRKLALPAALLVVHEVAQGLEAARTAGIVHRDLKPHNIFFAEQEGERRWKILDFGVSKTGTSGTLTKGHVVGTPAYMAPEQARGEDVDHRADVYSLAAILFRSVTGHPAFTGKDVPTTLYEVVYRVPTQPSMLAQLPGDVDRVIALGLAKDPRDRFATALELSQWLALAVADGLSPEQRRRADDLIAKAPWGTRPGISTIQ
jgi:serine/threonine-protein kinase